MKRKLVFLSTILLTAGIDGMKRPRPKEDPSICSNKRHHRVTSLLSLPEDMQNIIIDLVTNNSTAKKPKIAAKTINSLARTNKQFNKLINKPMFSDNLIKDLATKYYCSHETIAKYLQTKTSNKRLTLQKKLKELCLNKDLELNQKAKLDELINHGVNLDFIFSDNEFHKTILMMAAKSNPLLFKYLLEKDVNPNMCNAYGSTALHIAIEYPISQDILNQLINCPRLIINQQNNRGETPLLHSIINRKNFWITDIFLYAIKNLLLNGADPECIDNLKNTPLAEAENLDNEEVITIIKETIAKRLLSKD